VRRGWDFGFFFEERGVEARGGFGVGGRAGFKGDFFLGEFDGAWSHKRGLRVRLGFKQARVDVHALQMEGPGHDFFVERIAHAFDRDVFRPAVEERVEEKREEERWHQPAADGVTRRGRFGGIGGASGHRVRLVRKGPKLHYESDGLFWGMIGIRMRLMSFFTGAGIRGEAVASRPLRRGFGFGSSTFGDWTRMRCVVSPMLGGRWR
jgi:hypothetical protein